MRTLERWFPDWIRFRRSSSAASVCLFVSGTGVALSRQTELEEGTVAVDMAVDELRHARELPRALARQVDVLKAAGSTTVMVLAPELYSLSLIERPDVADDELKDAVRWRIQETVDFPVDQAALDVFPLPEGAKRDRPMVFVAALPRESLGTMLDIARGVKLHVTCVDITELALRNLLYRCFPEPDQAVAVVRLTPHGSLINITRGDELFMSRRISGVPGSDSAEDWADFQDRLVLQMQRSIDYYESGLGQPPCSALLVSLPATRMADVVGHLADVLPLPVKALREAVAQHFEVTLHGAGDNSGHGVAPAAIDLRTGLDPWMRLVPTAFPALGGGLRAAVDTMVGEG